MFNVSLLVVSITLLKVEYTMRILNYDIQSNELQLEKTY